MRVFWISIAVILIDQLTKYFLQHLPLTESVRLLHGKFSLVFLQDGSISSDQFQEAIRDSNTWLLIGTLIAFHTLITRLSTLSYFTSLRTQVGLQLASGGIASHAIDFLLRGSITSSAQLQIYDFSVKAGIADLSLMSGFIVLSYVLLQGRSQVKSRITLLHRPPSQLDLNALPRGVDNIHIDVHLSPEFCRTTNLVTHQLVEAAVNTFGKGAFRQTLNTSPLKPLKKLFLNLHQETLRKAKGSGEPQIIELFYIAVIKYIHEAVTTSVTTSVQKTKDTIQEHHKRGLGSANDNHYVERLFRHRNRIIATVNQAILNGLIEKNSIVLQKGIRGMLGRKGSFSLDALRAPLLAANSPECSDIQFKHYFLFGYGKHKKKSFLKLDRLLDELLHSYLNLIPEDYQEEDISNSMRKEFSGHTTAEILSQPSVLMHPANVTILFDQEWTRGKIEKTSRFKKWRKYRKFTTHLNFQQRLAERTADRLRKAGVSRWIVNFYEVRKLLNETYSDISPGALIAIMTECQNVKEIKQRLEAVCRTLQSPPDKSRIIERWQNISRNEAPLLKNHLFDFLDDFAKYRRDLLQLYKYQRAANQIVLQHEEKTLQTSRANFTLYEFMLPSEVIKDNATIRSHIIIKADLRGSTEVTDRLNQLALNPATHFERNFFTPINEVISEFGAEKVFIEGDAIILVLYDYASVKNGMVASRACALAAAILRIIAKHNKELTCYGLPELELGIGIAHSNESPRFLFDGDHKITISPAINRADRLSACAWSIRSWRNRLKAPATQVEVYQPSERALGHGEKAQKDLIFNSNGILIEKDVFEMLKKELSPKRIINNLPGKQDSNLYAIKISDSSGSTNSLVIRQAPVKLYDPDYQIEDCPIIDGRFFYELIYKQEILNALRKQSTATRH